VRLAQSLVELRFGQGAEVKTRLQEAVRLAGGGVVGWFRAALEATLMGIAEDVGAICGRELDRVRQAQPARDAILAIIGLLGATEIGVSQRVLAPLVTRIEGWLRAGACLEWSEAEFVTIAEQLRLFRLFEALQAYAGHAGARAPQQTMPRFFAIVAATQDDARRLTETQEEMLLDLEEQTRKQEDFRAGRYIRQFLDAALRAEGAGLPGERLDEQEVQALFDMALRNVPHLLPRKEIRRMVHELGRAEAVQAMNDMLCDSPFGMVLTPAQIHRLAEAAIARAAVPGSRA